MRRSRRSTRRGTARSTSSSGSSTASFLSSIQYSLENPSFAHRKAEADRNLCQYLARLESSPDWTATVCDKTLSHYQKELNFRRLHQELRERLAGGSILKEKEKNEVKFGLQRWKEGGGVEIKRQFTWDGGFCCGVVGGLSEIVLRGHEGGRVRRQGRECRIVLWGLWARGVLLNEAEAEAVARDYKNFKNAICYELEALLKSSSELTLAPAAALTMLEALLSRKSSASSTSYRSLYSEVWKAYEEYCMYPNEASWLHALRERLVAAYNSYDGADAVSKRDQFSLPRRRRNVLRAGMDVESEAGLDVVLAELRTARVPDGVRGAFSRAC